MIDSLESKVVLSTPVTSRNGKSTAGIHAHEIFLKSLPSSWIPREQVDNPHIDYMIELTEPGLPPIVFSVILKKSTSTKSDGSYLSQPFETENLSFYYSSFNEPILLILVDTKEESAYWLFLQEYVHNVLEKSLPNWRNNESITLKLPLANELKYSLDTLKAALFQGLELIYINKFHIPYRVVQRTIKVFFESTENLERALLIASARPYGAHLSQSKKSCSSDSCSNCSNDSEQQFDGSGDYAVQLSLDQAQGLKLLDPRENRKAYYCIYNALEQAGESVSAGMRYTAMGEMVFYDYLLHFMASFESESAGVTDHITRVDEHLRYFNAVNQLVHFMKGALDECELIPASLLSIRLADTYLFATPYISRTFGQDKAVPLMDFAQSLLILAHEMATLVESPNTVLQ